MAKINVLNKEVKLYTVKDEDYISLTDIARYKDSDRTDYIIQNWLRNRNTIEFDGIKNRVYSLRRIATGMAGTSQPDRHSADDLAGRG